MSSSASSDPHDHDPHAPNGEGHTCQCGSEKDEAGPPADLSHAGAVVDKAIEYMIGQNIGEMAIASALLGGALGMLARALADEAVVCVLENAIASVRAGELRQMGGTHP